MFKKICTYGFLLTVPILILFSAVFVSQAIPNRITLVLNGKDVTDLAAPVIENGRTLVPLRFISENMGAAVSWDGVNRTVTVAKEDKNTFLKIGSYVVRYNDGAVYNLSDVAPKIINDRTFVPLRLIGNALGIGIGWDADTRTVTVDSSKASEITPFSEVKITSLAAGDTLTGETSIQVSVPDSLAGQAAAMKLLLLDKNTGQGHVAAVVKQMDSPIDYLPGMADQGEKLLVAALFDNSGKFLGGDCLPVQIQIQPQVTLTGLSEGDVIKDSASISQSFNFVAAYVNYEMTNLNSGKVITIDHQDPQGTYKWTPSMEQAGHYGVKVIAFDESGNPFESNSVLVEANVDRKLSLTGVSAGTTINKSVTLLASRNFDVSQTQYIARDPATGIESIIATVPYGQYVWFPGPEFSGEKELLVRVKDGHGVVYDSAPIPVTIDGSPKVMLQGIGPSQVVTAATKLSVKSNVPLENVGYLVTDSAGQIKRTLAAGTDQTGTFTPENTDPQNLSIQVTGKYQDQTITGEKIPFKVFLGTLYGPKPLIEKDQFLDMVSGLAKNSWSTTGMSAALQTAQAILETGWGQSVPVDKYNGTFSYNLFGIKGAGPQGSVVSNTWEVYNGVTYRVDAAFKAYSSAEESWNDRNRFLLTGARYAPFRDVMYNGTLGAWALKRAGYATDPQYPIKLMNLMKQYNLLELDKVSL